MSIQFLSGGRPVVRKFQFSPEDDPARLVISNPVSSVRYVISFQSWSRAPIVTNWGKAGLGTGERPASETGSTDDGLLDSSKNKHNPVMVYNDLMIRYIHRFSNYNIRPVTTGDYSVSLSLGLGHRSTDAGRPGCSPPTVL